MTKAERILRHIAASERGLTLREIQEYIHGINHPVADVTPVPRSYYTTNLFGGWRYVGLLRTFCRKLSRRRYVVTEPIAAPFYRRARSRTAEAGLRALERKYARRALKRTGASLVIIHNHSLPRSFE